MVILQGVFILQTDGLIGTTKAQRIGLKPSPKQGIPSEPSGSEPGGSERATMTTTDPSLASCHWVQELILEPLGRVSQ